ncbi:hypothetical protein Vadar_029725 [Vaccinium darrowii]|uniref:Uncharacterized protein n=1 Tax=Vaccinium darrowii TaxID=229202 RepID=A0ACB7XV39_9ERIC|nr:hypothetical protein Vadar_029725 [Vaccinium darrowii]
MEFSCLRSRIDTHHHWDLLVNFSPPSKMKRNCHQEKKQKNDHAREMESPTSDFWFPRPITPAKEAPVSSIFSIPNPILMEILSRLPITTIRNCRCVCSAFRNLISDPHFPQLQLARAQSSLMLRFPMCFVESIDPFVDSGVNGDICISTNTLLKFKPKSDVPMQGLEVLSSCNGLICFYGPGTYNPYVICNPVINEYVIVPQTEKVLSINVGSGFGFCSRTNQYKVLRLLSPSKGFWSKLEAEINTLGTNLWRRVGDGPPYLHWYSGGCFLNGALHWIVHDTENCFKSMCCFNFGKEQFQPFPGPSEFCGLRGQLKVDKMKMGVLKDDLSVFHHSTNDRLDIWVMKDYAVQESWTNDFIIEVPWVEAFCGLEYQPLMSDDVHSKLCFNEDCCDKEILLRRIALGQESVMIPDIETHLFCYVSYLRKAAQENMTYRSFENAHQKKKKRTATA